LKILVIALTLFLFGIALNFFVGNTFGVVKPLISTPAKAYRFWIGCSNQLDASKLCGKAPACIAASTPTSKTRSKRSGNLYYLAFS
jgi:hypothetical protein